MPTFERTLPHVPGVRVVAQPGRRVAVIELLPVYDDTRAASPGFRRLDLPLELIPALVDYLTELLAQREAADGEAH